MNEAIKKAKESLKLIHADIEEGMDKKFIDIDWGLELNRLTKPIETALNQAEENEKAVNQFCDILKLLKSNCKYALRHNDFNTFCVISVNENLNYNVEKTICLNEVMDKYGK